MREGAGSVDTACSYASCTSPIWEIIFALAIAFREKWKEPDALLPRIARIAAHHDISQMGDSRVIRCPLFSEEVSAWGGHVVRPVFILLKRSVNVAQGNDPKHRAVSINVLARLVIGFVWIVLTVPSCLPANAQLPLKTLLTSNTPRPDTAQSGQATFGPYNPIDYYDPLGYTFPVTDGKNVAFNVGLYPGNSPNCAAGQENSIWSMPVQGGTPTLLAGYYINLESDQPSGATTTTCTGIAQGDGALFFYGQYTGTNGTRAGVWSVPLAGGTSADVLVSGDTAQNGTLIESVLDKITAGSDGSVNAPALIPGGSYADGFHNTFGTTLVQPGYPDCSAYNLFGTVSNIYTDGTTYAAYSIATLKSGTSVDVIFESSSESTLFKCASIVFEATLVTNPITPLPGIPSAPYSGMGINYLIVDQGRIFVDAQQLYGTTSANSTLYGGIFQVTSGGLVKIFGNYDAVPGLNFTTLQSPGYAPAVPGVDQTFALRGNWMAVRFIGSTEAICSSTQTYNTVQADIAVNLNTGVAEKVVATGDILGSAQNTVGGVGILIDGSLSVRWPSGVSWRYLQRNTP